MPHLKVDLDLSVSPDAGLQMIFATIILTGLLYYFFAPDSDSITESNITDR